MLKTNIPISSPPDLPAPDQRRPILLRRRDAKMARSPHAYVRGNTAQYYDWLHSLPGQRLPRGPAIWICGDCHVGNLGPVADSTGKVRLQLRDFDQTTLGNPTHDLIRLGLSLATAARGSSLPGVVTAHMLQHMLLGYQRAFFPGHDGLVAKPRDVKLALRGAQGRSWKVLARERAIDLEATIPLGRNFWPLSETERQAIDELFAGPCLRQLGIGSDTEAVVLDAAYWVKGCSSLGLLRYAVLVEFGGRRCLMDIKEAVAAASPRYPRASMPRDNAKRVLQGASHLSPALGERMAACRFMDRGVFVRELMPQDLKLEIEQLSMAQAVRTASYLAYVVGQAHAAQLDASTRANWLQELMANPGKYNGTPEWLWKSVVQLVASHEAGYLEHCRNYAMAEK
ncbi:MULTISPECIES: DUF2252 family protein [unclassified Duganella]|uniref:DUF2252 family protein n=1 Tax=unclassified Duganella TaxID=2636909 RepID=UPI000877D173|nr:MULTISPECIES: DUF2252 family protein [unclassified Duganella]OEZ63860.1 hypothetical protein DUGA6_03610 [Duganella sp. HH105]OFA06987.1 hypothetical protein DUGA2_03190 [Duganella sp. HH101]